MSSPLFCAFISADFNKSNTSFATFAGNRPGPIGPLLWDQGDFLQKLQRKYFRKSPWSHWSSLVAKIHMISFEWNSNFQCNNIFHFFLRISKIFSSKKTCNFNSKLSRDTYIISSCRCNMLCVFHFYFTDAAELDFVAPIPGAECETLFLVSVNSPK